MGSESGEREGGVSELVVSREGKESGGAWLERVMRGRTTAFDGGEREGVSVLGVS